jgi:hypothetical protein
MLWFICLPLYHYNAHVLLAVKVIIMPVKNPSNLHHAVHWNDWLCMTMPHYQLFTINLCFALCFLSTIYCYTEEEGSNYRWVHGGCLFFLQFTYNTIIGYYYSLFGLVDQTIDGRRERERERETHTDTQTHKERFTNIKLLYTKRIHTKMRQQESSSY